MPLTGDQFDPATVAALRAENEGFVTDPRLEKSLSIPPDITTNDNIDMLKVKSWLSTTVKDPLKAAGIVGIIEQELGDGNAVRTEGMGYKLKGAKSSFNSGIVTKALAALTPAERAKVNRGEASTAFGKELMDLRYDGGHKYRGRGLVQLTHKNMYKKVGDMIGVDLVANPDLVNDPKYAVQAALAFLTIKDYFGKETTKESLRKIVNPGQTDKKMEARWSFVTDALADSSS